ncbi:MAG: hypothetical protein KIT76_06705 [Pseudolabrys sp.]|nr:hypothetical protein [Pseudolabrys sp.]
MADAISNSTKNQRSGLLVARRSSTRPVRRAAAGLGSRRPGARVWPRSSIRPIASGDRIHALWLSPHARIAFGGHSDARPVRAGGEFIKWALLPKAATCRGVEPSVPETSILQVLGGPSNAIYLEYMPWFVNCIGSSSNSENGDDRSEKRPGWGFTFNMDYVERLKT